MSKLIFRISGMLALAANFSPAALAHPGHGAMEQGAAHAAASPYHWAMIAGPAVLLLLAGWRWRKMRSAQFSLNRVKSATRR